MYRDLMTLQDRMNRLFQQALPRHEREDESLFGGSWIPAVDIFENEQNVVLTADLPDIDPKGVDIRIENNVLTVKGERKMEKEAKEENYHRIERSYGTFARSFSLPHTIAAEKISADYKNGVLRITMPKREETKPKQIQVNIGT